MSDTKHHPRYHPRHDDLGIQHVQNLRPSPSESARQFSRIPTKSAAPLDNSKQRTIQPPPHQHVSRLARRPSRIAPPETSAQKGDGAYSSRPAGPPRSLTSEPAKPSSITSPTSSHSHRYSMLPPPTIRTPSLVSGSSVSTFDSPQSNPALRRKPSGAIDRYANQKRLESANEADRSATPGRNDVYGDLVLGISLPVTSAYALQQGEANFSNVVIPPRSEPRHAIPTRTPESATAPASIIGNPAGKALASPAYSVGPSVTPSTRFTDSPFSYAPTPSSASSYSPVLTKSSSSGRTSSPVRHREPHVVEKASNGGDSLLRNEVPLVREPSPAAPPGTRKANSSAQASGRKTSAHVKTTPTVERPVTRKKLTKVQHPNSTTRTAAVQTPPELAHLNVEPPKTQKSLPPSRPSRDDVTSIFETTDPSPVVQSDLPRMYTAYHKRNPSQEGPLAGGSPSLKSRLGLSPKSSNKGSPRIDSAISPPPTAPSFTRDPTLEVAELEPSRTQRRDSPAIGSESSSAKASRFGFFSRKPKTDVAKVPDKPRRTLTKGPAAGTGHEGYGRFSSTRGRSGSVTSSNGIRSPSTDSTTSSVPRPVPSRKASSRASKDSSDLDEFLKERLNPVILRGSGSTTTSNGLSALDVPATTSKHPSTSSSLLDANANPRLLPSAMHDATQAPSPEKRIPLERRKTSDSSDSSMIGDRPPQMAIRRSLKRTSQIDSSPDRLDAITQQNSTEAHRHKVDPPTSRRELPPPSSDPYLGKEGLWLRPGNAGLAPRKSRFADRAQAFSSAVDDEKSDNRMETVETSSQRVMAHHFAHYAMLGAVEPMDLEEVERILYESDVSPRDSAAEPSVHPKMVPYEKRHASLLPSPPKLDDRSTRLSDSVQSVDSQRPIITLERQDSAEAAEILHARKGLVRRSPQVVSIARSPSLSQGHTPKMPTVISGRRDIDGEELSQAGRGTPERVNSMSNSPRQPRLSPIGRIPRVVSRRDRDRKLPDASFSRPFARAQPRPSVKPPGSVYSSIREMASPIESIPQQLLSGDSIRSSVGAGEHHQSDSYAAMYTEPSLAATRNYYEGLSTKNEFLSFGSRKNSDQSHRTYSSSSGNQSWLNALYAQPPQQEDVWNEYNDFMDDIMPLKTPTTGSSLGAPFQYSNILYEPVVAIPPITSPPPMTDLPQVPDMSDLTPVLMSTPQFARFLQVSASNITADTVSAFIEGYGSGVDPTPKPSRASLSAPQHRSGLVYKPSRASFPSVRSSIASSRYSQPSEHSRPTSLAEDLTPSTRRKSSYAQLQGIPEPISHRMQPSLRLRSGALLTSKLLSFGRVLFSPAHNEMLLAQDPRVLVVDGLSSDWSYFVAQAYPSATVYNLAFPDDPAANFWPDPTRPPPANHKQIPFPSLAHAFPFPRGFFNAVVFRFPTATTERAYQSAIFECNRVLRPGGYLEVALLDLDLMNMGNRARKSVRGLKTRMQTCDNNVCLANLSDVLVRLIGRRGFENLQRCIVGVPAAMNISPNDNKNKSGGSASDLSSSDTDNPLLHSHFQSQLSATALADDLSPPSTATDPLLSPDNPTSSASSSSNPLLTDSSFTNLMSRVARWWYAACYERALPPPSIWTDRALRRECASQGASFRLLIAHAQKPNIVRRRTVSV